MVTRDFMIYIYQLTEYDETNIPGKYQRSGMMMQKWRAGCQL